MDKPTKADIKRAYQDLVLDCPITPTVQVVSKTFSQKMWGNLSLLIAVYGMFRFAVIVLQFVNTQGGI